VPNNSPENRARNRRVDVIILKSEEQQAAERRQEALNYLESEASDGIIMEIDPEDLPSSTASTETEVRAESETESTVIAEDNDPETADVIEGDTGSEIESTE
jgi:hypothetical protein